MQVIKLMTVISQFRVINNDAMKKGLVNFLVKS